jgi:hypothetical protein
MAKLITLEELKEHSTKDNLYILLHEKGRLRPIKWFIFALCSLTAHETPIVYDVTKFIDEVWLAMRVNSNLVLMYV